MPAQVVCTCGWESPWLDGPTWGEVTAVIVEHQREAHPAERRAVSVKTRPREAA